MTQAPRPESESPHKLLAARGTRLRLAVMSGVILGAGALMAPRTTQTTLTTPQEHAAPLLEEQVQPRATALPFRGVQDLASRLRQHSVAIVPTQKTLPQTRSDFTEHSEAAPADRSGVFVSGTHVLTHADALDGRSSVLITATDGSPTEARVEAFEPESGLVLLQTQATTRQPAAIAGEPRVPGTLAVAVGRSQGGDFVVPVFITSASADRYTLSGQGTITAGMPLFDMNGELFAIAGDDGHTGFAVREAATRLLARASAGERWSAVGLAFQVLEGSLTRVLGEKGVLVSDVVDGGPGDDAGVTAGDVLLAVGDAEVNAIDDAVRALRAVPPGTPVRLRLLRAGRTRTLDVTPVTAYEVAALARGRPVIPSFPEARRLFSRSQLDSSGIPASARVVTVHATPPVSRAQVQRALRTARQPVLVLLSHDGRQFFAAIEPAR
jgi:S1-C subfamily serine protease